MKRLHPARPRAESSLGPVSMKSRINRGTWRKSSRNGWLPSPTMKCPRRMANRWNRLDTTVKTTEAVILVRRFGVPRNLCTSHSSEWPIEGSTTLAASAPRQGGSRRLSR